MNITEDPSSDQLPLPDYDLKVEVEQTPLKGSIRELLWESPSQTPRNRRVVRREVEVKFKLMKIAPQTAPDHQEDIWHRQQVSSVVTCGNCDGFYVESFPLKW